jgi:uncharacterized RDD family membrane protein YckC
VCQCGPSIAAEEFAAGERVAAVIDPEQYDPSEERFASSLASRGAALGSEPVVDVTTALEAAARAERLAQLRPARRTIVLVEPKSPERTLEPGEWRREVSSRVSRYRARRRPRPERNRSLSLNFEPAPPIPAAAALPTTKEVVPVPRSEPNVQHEVLPEAKDLMAMEIDAYGVERSWPNKAPRNENPFWKHAAQVAHSEATQAEDIEPSEPVHLEDMLDGRETHAISHQFDGSTVSDLTSDLSEAISEEEPGNMRGPENDEIKVVEFPVALPPEGREKSTHSDWIQGDREAAPSQATASEALLSEADEVLAEPPAGLTRVFEAEEISQFAAEAQATIEPAPPIATVELPAMAQQPEVQPEIRSFAPIAPVYLRVFAEATDGAISLSGVLLFSTILMWLGAMPTGRSFTMLAAILPGFFWSLYQYLFLVNAGSTPGMRLAGLKLAGFDENTVTRQRRRARALSICISTLALGLGLIWALLDIDHLCWHDRASRTFLTRG